MFGLEELTKEELIGWIRENISEIDEGDIVKKTLLHRIKYAAEKSASFFERYKEVSSKASELIMPYIPGGAKSGTKIYNVPADVVQQHNELRKKSEDLWTEYTAWSDIGREASQRIAEFAEIKQRQSYGGK